MMLAPMLLAAVLQATPPPGLAPGTIAIVQARIEAAMARLGVPGVAAAVVAREELVWSAPFGEADLENDVPVRTDTMFRLGSLSKPITATAVLQLAERGKLDLDAPVQRYVPTFPEKPWPVTSRLLLAHLGGIRHYQEGEFGSTRRYATATEALHIFRDDPLAHEPGTRFLYTTYGYNLLGCAVEGASGQSFMDYVRANVLEPAGMFSARDDDAQALIRHRAQGYVKNALGELRNSGLADTSNKVPGGGMCATVEDVARFAMALQGGVLLNRDSLARMLTRCCSPVCQASRTPSRSVRKKPSPYPMALPSRVFWRVSMRANGSRPSRTPPWRAMAKRATSSTVAHMPPPGTLLLVSASPELRRSPDAFLK
jgi:CubicO group peptidase (beta-lactamase class C family)